MEETMTTSEAVLAQQWQDLLSDSVPGGIMGGYIEPNFPFFFINNRMLDYLGYVSEAEFVNDICGLISNCIHPDDRNMVNFEVSQQISESGQYVVEYRMKKRDGSYIWVHDLGRRVIAENGKPAILSVCSDITAQKKVRLEIMHLYNNVPGAVFRCRYDKDFTIVDANDGLYEFLGYTREEFMELGNQMSAVIHPDDLISIDYNIIKSTCHDDTIRAEQRIICKNGSIKWVSLKALIMPGEDGTDYFYGVFMDITDEKLAQERIRDLYKKELTYFAQAASTKGSIQGRVNVTQNRVESYQSSVAVASVQIGDTYEYVIESLANSALNPEYGTYLRATLDRTQVLSGFVTGDTDLNFEFLRRQKDGGIFWNRTNFKLQENPESGDVISFFYTLDITEQRMQEQLLSKVAELDYEILSDIDIRNDTYHIVSANPGTDIKMDDNGRFEETAKKIASTYMDKATGQEYLSRLKPANIQQDLAKHGSYSFMAETRSEHGARVKRYRIFYISQELGRVCIARSDVTDILQQEKKQKEALASALSAAEQANIAKTDFLSRISHEIRTPMNAIIGMSTIAAQSLGDDVRVADCISKIDIASRFLLSLINDILDMSRIESGKMFLNNERIVTTEFLDNLNAICCSQAAEKGILYECIADASLDSAYMGDSMKLQQVLLNVLSNAIKFTDREGKVTFSASQQRKINSNAVLRFVVTDTGIGISEDFLHQIFRPFAQEFIGTTSQYGGTGLGLAISKNIVDMMDGSITVHSVKGIGSEFTVDVQLGIINSEMSESNKATTMQGNYKESAALCQPAEYDFSGRRILLVEDNDINTEVAATLLEHKGFSVDTAKNGQEAVDLFAISETGFYDAILMDIRMPLMDGLTATSIIRHMDKPDAKSIPIIAMTANAFYSDIEKSLAASMNAHLAKPIDPKLMYQVLYDLINGHTSDK